MSLFFDRIREPSTWAGLATGVLGMKLLLPSSLHLACDMASGVFGAIAVALRDPGHKSAT